MDTFLYVLNDSLSPKLPPLLHRLSTRTQAIWQAIRRSKPGGSSEKYDVPALEVHLLSHRDIEPFSLTVKQREIFGLVGPGGSGKSTIIDLLSGRKTPIDGAISVMGFDFWNCERQVKKLVGVLPQIDLNILGETGTPVQHLQFHARLIGMKERPAQERIPIVLTQVGLARHEHLQVKAFSSALKQRLALARALLHDPKLLLLDEPTHDVVEQERSAIWEVLCSLRIQGMTILLATQNWEEVSALCDRVGQLSQGKLAAVWERASSKEPQASSLKLPM